MNKKILTLFLTLFLLCILSISCSNESKTGSDNNQDPAYLSQYKGIWSFSKDFKILTINEDGTCDLDGIKSSSIQKKSDKVYNVVFTMDMGEGVNIIIDLDLTFDTESSGTAKGTQKSVSADGTINYSSEINSTITKK